jgi:hypothetical protein
VWADEFAPCFSSFRETMLTIQRICSQGSADLSPRCLLFKIRVRLVPIISEINHSLLRTLTVSVEHPTGFVERAARTVASLLKDRKHLLGFCSSSRPFFMVPQCSNVAWMMLICLPEGVAAPLPASDILATMKAGIMSIPVTGCSHPISTPSPGQLDNPPHT